MRIATIKLTVQIARRMGYRPWSQQARALMRLILTTARGMPNNPWIRQSKHEKLFLAVQALTESLARESIADALEVSSLSAWTFQRDLGEWLKASAG